MTQEIKVSTVIGARPQFVKAAVVSKAFAEWNTENPSLQFNEQIIHTGQHYDSDMSEVFFAELGIPACPLYVVNQDMGYTRQLLELLGPKARTTLLPNGRLFKSGAIVAGTSDWPGSPIINPFVLMEVTVTRQAPGGKGDLIGSEEDRLTIEQAVKSFTWNGAWTMGLEKETGSIEEGKSADFIVLNQNLFEVSSTEIHKTDVVKTIFKGAEVYDSSVHKDRVADLTTKEILSLLEAFQCRCRSPYRAAN